MDVNEVIFTISAFALLGTILLVDWWAKGR